jgi:murein L,D-transpeptidase YafK
VTAPKNKPGRRRLLVCLVASFPLLVLFLVVSKALSANRSAAAIARVKPRLEAELREKGLGPGSSVFIRIFKESRELEVWIRAGKEFQLFRIYEICRYSGGLGPKLKEGDGQSPEGFYEVGAKQMNPQSRFHLSFNLGFPNAYDRALGRTGSFLMVHGACVSSGCYAMTDSRIEEIYVLADEALRQGRPHFQVHIFPFRMTDQNLARHKSSRWRSFWMNLKTGYDWFEEKKFPPKVEVNAERYSFSEADPPR